jgi:alpha-beta hydrolase superfamily lysophospholipase
MKPQAPQPAEPSGADPPAKPRPTSGRRHPVQALGLLLSHILRPAKTLLRLLASAIVGGILVLVVVAIAFLNSKADLDLWHEVELEEEFTGGSEVSDFAGYLQLEDRLFAELDSKVYTVTPAAAADSINRYHGGSLADPRTRGQNWNRSFELLPADGPPKNGVLLLHGMSDSPYSLARLGEELRLNGSHVVGLRLPGHGTAPSGLVDFQWEDMAEAVEIAMRHLKAKLGERPIYIVGYSNGGALAINHGLQALHDNSLPAAQGIVLISPAIGVSRMAALAVWQGRLGHWLGLDKLAWTSIGPEYDPFKYVSFAANAGDQVHRLTIEIDRHLDQLAGTGKLEEFPPVIAFQSVVDATVSAPALVEVLFDRLPGADHELVLFDIDRRLRIENLMASDPTEDLAAVLRSPDHEFAITLLTNQKSEDASVEVRTWRMGLRQEGLVDLDLEWPKDVYSLSHLALPFAKQDELYGEPTAAEDEDDTALRLGNIAFRGERGLLKISPSDQLRLRWNPFYSYLEDRVVQFIGTDKDGRE